MSPSPHLLLLLSLLALFLPCLLASSSFPLPTVAIAAVTTTNATTAGSPHHLACALVPSGTAATDYQLSCASVTDRSSLPYNYSYGGGGSSTAFSALVAGDGYLCSAGPTSSSRAMAMRWWDLNDGEDAPSKRVYSGKALSAVSGGGEYVCGIADEKIHCWRWPSKTLPTSVNFSSVAVGGGFVCGLVKSSGEVRCFGDDWVATRAEPPPKGSHSMLAAGERHACAVRAEDGEIVCWGEAAAVAAASPGTTTAGRAVSSLAVGDAVTCVLWGNWTVTCWPPEEAAPPPSVAQQQFVALEAKGKVVCGVLMSDYSLVCWGPTVAAAVAAGEAPVSGVSKVFDRVLPGPCAPWASCRCGVWSGSGPLCGGGNAVCYPCGFSPPPLPATTSNSSTSHSSGNNRRPSDLVIALVSAGIGSGVLAAIAAVVVVYCLRRRRRSSGIHAEPPETNVPPPRVERRLSALLSKGPNTTVEQFPLAALRVATGGFSLSHRIGSGSFGTVYRASLPDGREVAIKRAEPRRSSGDHHLAGGNAAASSSTSTAAAARRVSNNETAFVSELALLSRVNHKNLVRLLGFCADGGERILVYEYMPNGTLHDHLHKLPSLSPPLATWPARLRLALGAARGIEYMHTYAVPPIIHRDIKSPNILLDADWNAKVSDFGLSLLKLNDNLGTSDGNVAGDEEDDEPCVVTAGTVGYMDPEYYRLQHLTDKSDVYSFGVVLLELLSGCKVIQRFEGSGTPKNVVDVTVPHIEADRVHRVLDARLPLPTPGEMEAVAYVGYLASDCVRPAGRDRPTMSEVVGVLERAVAACEENDDGDGGGGEAAGVLSRSCTDGSTTA